MNNGLSCLDLKTFNDMIIKANTEQLDAMSNTIFKEKIKRIKVKLMFVNSKEINK